MAATSSIPTIAMLAQEKLDIVSISTWPHLHAEMVIAAAEAGVKAVPLQSRWP